MLAKVFSGTTIGLSATLIEVEVDIPEEGLPAFNIVGLPDKAIEESKERVRAAIKNSGANFPIARITVNLAPADLPKNGPSYDLPIALGILMASGQLYPIAENVLFFGELSLDGSLRHTSGILPLTYLAREKKFQSVYIPKANEKEASVVPGVDVYPAENLLQVVRSFLRTFEIEKAPKQSLKSLLKVSEAEFDFSEVIGQEFAKRALEISAAGSHNLF